MVKTAFFLLLSSLNQEALTIAFLWNKIKYLFVDSFLCNKCTNQRGLIEDSKLVVECPIYSLRPFIKQKYHTSFYLHVSSPWTFKTTQYSVFIQEILMLITLPRIEGE